MHSPLTGGYSQLRHRVVIPAHQPKAWWAGTTTQCQSCLIPPVRNYGIRLMYVKNVGITEGQKEKEGIINCFNVRNCGDATVLKE